MNDNDIIKALECLGGNSDLCQQCAYYPLEFPRCKENCAKDTLDIITRQKAKIEALEMDNAQLQSDNINANMNCEHLQAEIERLKEENEIYKECNRIIAYQRDRSNEETQELRSELSRLNLNRRTKTC